MTDFARTLAKCQKTTALSATVVDEFLMYYVAGRERLEKEMDQRLSRFRNVTKSFPPSLINMMKAQYICHRIFKEDGLIKKYLTQAAVKALPAAQQAFLKKQADSPWRYSYSLIISNPAPDFYEMEDVFNGETFLLHSSSITQILTEQPVVLWFNLISFNGSCWQTFGPVLHFNSIEPDDIFFFASELNAGIETETDLRADLEENPVPYLMLFVASTYPRTVHGDDEILQVISEYLLDDFSGSKLKNDFILEFTHGVYRLKPNKWSEPPHFAAAYFDEKKKKMLLTSLTDRGFREMVNLLNKYDFDFPEDPDIRVHISMTTSMKKILGNEQLLNPYEELFEVKPKPSEKDMMAKLNRLLALALPFINSGQEPDIDALAKEAGVDIDTARDLLSHSMGRINTLLDKTGKKGKK